MPSWGSKGEESLQEWEFEIAGDDFENAGEATLKLRKCLKASDLERSVIRRVLLACFEAEINVVMYARSGVLRARLYKDRIRVEIEDIGYGIESVEQAMTEGFTTSTERIRQCGYGAGMGLPNIRRNTDRLSVMSSPGEGTVLWFDVEFTKRNTGQKEK